MSPILEKHGSYPDFQGRVDSALHKADPAQSIPWGKAAPPWAARFRPRRILDLGCATAQFTAAVLQRLADWDCLGDLTELVLVEKDPGFDGSSDATGERSARNLCADVLRSRGASNTRVRTVNAPILLKSAIATEPHSRAPNLVAGGELLPKADLIIASHFTYYFADSEATLVKAIIEHLSHGGLAWLVIRRRDCPIYRAREYALRKASILEGEEPGYAEDFKCMISAAGSPARLVDARKLEFLAPTNRPADCFDLAHLLMWRRSLDAKGRLNELEAVRIACEFDEPLYSECHLVLAEA